MIRGGTSKPELLPLRAEARAVFSEGSLLDLVLELERCVKSCTCPVRMFKVPRHGSLVPYLP
jgi:hypothetical protein